MKIADLHTHTYLCNHASGTPEAFLEAAQKRGESWYGITDHCPWPDGFDSQWRMKVSEFPLYRDIVRDMQKLTEGTSLKVLYGIEMDYVPGKMELVQKNLANEDFDYIIGSIHYIEKFAFDNPELLGEWRKEGTAEHVWNVYTRYMHDYVATCDFQIMGHADLPKKFGFPPVFNEDFVRSWREIFEMASEKGIVLELNTAGLHAQIGEIYPSAQLLKLARKAGMRVCYGSDAHAPEMLGRDFDAAVSLARECGFEGFVFFEKKRPGFLPFS